MCSSSFCFTLLQKPGVEGPMQWFSSIAARVAQLKEPRSAEPNVWVQTPAGPSTKVFKKTGEPVILAVKPLSQFRWSRHWSSLCSSWKGT